MGENQIKNPHDTQAEGRNEMVFGISRASSHENER